MRRYKIEWNKTRGRGWTPTVCVSRCTECVNKVLYVQVVEVIRQTVGGVIGRFPAVFPTGVLGGGGGGGPGDRIRSANGSIFSLGVRANEPESPGKAVSSPDKGGLEKRAHLSNEIAFSYVPIVERELAIDLEIFGARRRVDPAHPAPSWSEHLI
jgi:hypothetical protein